MKLYRTSRSTLPLFPHNTDCRRASHMKTLRAVSKSRDITWREFPEGTHNDTVAADGYFQAILEFVEKVAPRKQSG